MHEALHRICERHILPESLGAVFAETYYPHLPEKWNGILVLAEAQNLADSKSAYVRYLAALSPDDRIRRLNLGDGQGVMPWRDGSLPLGLAALLPDEPMEAYAVSNAVPWSLQEAPGRNANPNKALIEKARLFWTEIFPELKPQLVVASGAIARDVVATTFDGPVLHIRLPSPNAMARVASLFDPDDLLRRYPEVAQALDRLPWIKELSYLHNKIFFACHVLSVGKTIMSRMTLR